MNNAVHQLTKLILEAMAWVLNTAASLWVWSWTQIAALFGMAWGDLPGWKLAVGIAVLAVLAAILVIVAIRAWDALGRIAAAFWTMALTLFTPRLRHRRRTVLARIPVGGRQHAGQTRGRRALNARALRHTRRA